MRATHETRFCRSFGAVALACAFDGDDPASVWLTSSIVRQDQEVKVRHLSLVSCFAEDRRPGAEPRARRRCHAL